VTTNATQRLWLFLYGTPNIVGSALGLVGLLLYFAGIINAFWFLIVVGLYAIGVVATPRNPTVDLQLRNQVTVEAVRAELEELVRAVRRKLPKELLAKVESIKESILSILPKIVDVNSGDYNTYVIRQTALEYLPDALENFLNLPPAYANLHPVKNGKTARQLLGDQLDLLDTSMKQIVEDFHRNDTQKILIHGRFLAEKFHKGDVLGT
jgi:hypothetical protein